MTKYNWLTENISDSLNRQGGEEGGNECILQESHVMQRVGGVQQTGKCGGQFGQEIHLWKMIFCDHFTNSFIQYSIQAHLISNTNFECPRVWDL